MTKLKIMPHAVGAYLKGVGVESVELDANNHLIVYLDNGETVDAGEFKVDYALSSTSSRPLANKTIMALKGALETMISRTQESIDNRINALVGNNATTAIDNFNEIISFFEGVTDSETLVAKIAEINASIAAEQSRVNDELASKVDKVTGKGLSTNDYTDEEKAQVAKIGGKQDTLSLTVKDNGNIVLGNIAGQTKEFMPATPSGDPMHYAYIDAGATWSSSTGYWSLNGLTDITNEQMRKIYNFGGINDLSHSPLTGSLASIRTNLLRVGLANYYNYQNEAIDYLAADNSTIEVITLNNKAVQYESGISVLRADFAFLGCTKLREIYGRLIVNSPMLNTFQGCSSLQRVRIQNLGKNLILADCPNIDKDSILYAINNSAATSAITIRLHPTAYAKYSADSDIQAALAAKPLVTLISV
jgi:hypothetical protein